MEYLFAQTGKVLPSVSVDIDFTEVELSEEEEEGIADVLDDMTLSALEPGNDGRSRHRRA